MDNMNSNRDLYKVERKLRSRDMQLNLDEAFYERLHNKIMNEVSKTEIQETTLWHRSRNLVRAHWKGWTYPVGGMMALFALVMALTPHMSNFNQTLERAGLYSDGQERILQEALLDPELLSQTLIISQQDSDFFMDVAQYSFENFTIEKINKLMGEARK